MTDHRRQQQAMRRMQRNETGRNVPARTDQPATPAVRSAPVRQPVELKPGTVLPTARPAATPHVQQWAARVEHWKVYIPAVDKDTGEEITIPIRHAAIFVSTSGGPDCLPDHYRIFRTVRKGVVSLSLGTSMTGEPNTWQRTQSLTRAEALAWLTPRVGIDRSVALMNDLLS